MIIYNTCARSYNIEEIIAYYDWKDRNAVSNCISFCLCNRTLTPIEEPSQSEKG